MVAPSKMQSAKDMPSHKIMKTRAPGQNTAAEVVRRDLRAELEARERKHFKLDKLEDFESAPRSLCLALRLPCFCSAAVGHSFTSDDVE